jgi:hypothetical protein
MKKWRIVLMIGLLISAMTPVMAANSMKYDLTDYFGVTRNEVVSYLTKNKSRFLGTPYGADKAHEDPVPGKKGHMQCTGFIWYVLYNMPVKKHHARNEIPDGVSANKVGWVSWANKNNIRYYDFKTKKNMLDSGILEKGDIIWSFVDGGVTTKNGSHHVGFFWGDSPHDDKYWHSSNRQDKTSKGNLIEGIVTGNRISKIEPKKPTVKLWRVYKWKTVKKYRFTLLKSATTEGVNTSGDLSGAIFSIHNDSPSGKEVGRLVTDKEGKALSPELEEGIYYIKEETPPKNYQIMDNPIKVNLNAENIICKSVDRPSLGQVKLVKHNHAKPLPHVIFSLRADEDFVKYKKGDKIEQLETDEKGEAVSSKLGLGKYYVVEEKTVEGHVLDQKEYHFTLSKDNEVYTLNNGQPIINRNVVISKTDITTGKEVKGAHLTIFEDTNKSGVLDQNERNIVDEWESDGSEHLAKGLKTDHSYILSEVLKKDDSFINGAPEGYVKSEDVAFSIDSHSDVIINGKVKAKVEMKDNVYRVYKKDMADQEVEGAHLCVFEDRNQNKKCDQGEEVDEWISDNKAHPIKGLEENHEYILTETMAPEGYQIANSMSFKVKNDKVEKTIIMHDDYLYTDLIVEKVDEEGKVLNDKSGVFGLYKDKKCIMKKHLENGQVKFDHLLFGTYIIKEEEAPKGYELNRKEEIVHINNDTRGDGTITLTVMNRKHYEVKKENKEVKLSKKTVETGDSTSIIAIVLMMVISLAIIFTIGFRH